MVESGDRHQVVAAVLVDGESVLLCRRSPDRAWYPGVWDLPGGHVEAGEQASDALTRELHEELGIRIGPPGLPAGRLTGADFDLQVWVIRTWSGPLVNRAPDEHDRIGWFTEEEAAELALADDRHRSLIASALRIGPR